MAMDESRVVERSKASLQNLDQAKSVFGRARDVSPLKRAARYMSHDKEERKRRRAVMEAFKHWRRPDA